MEFLSEVAVKCSLFYLSDFCCENHCLPPVFVTPGLSDTMISESEPTCISVNSENASIRTLLKEPPVYLVALEQSVRLKAQVG